jgi:predicted transposase/invertase (TIGR01784 family)
MKRDTIFYQLFKRSPEIIFSLLPNAPSNAQEYTFSSPAVKETTFTIDGVFSPPDSSGDILFAEVQFQPDQQLDERIFSEVGMYIYRNLETFNDWRIVIVYPSRKMEQTISKMPPELFDSGRIIRIYLDELGNIDQLPTGAALMVLTTLEGAKAITAAKAMLSRSARSVDRRAIMDLVVTIMAYKFKNLSQSEVNNMLGIELQEVRAFREAEEKGRIEGELEGELKGEQKIVLRLLNLKLGRLSAQNRKKVEALDTDRLQELAEALLNFNTPIDLSSWLAGTRNN